MQFQYKTLFGKSQINLRLLILLSLAFIATCQYGQMYGQYHYARPSFYRAGNYYVDAPVMAATAPLYRHFEYPARPFYTAPLASPPMYRSPYAFRG
uniref:Secreted protein n=1 Tax=Rhabditophanes sp. KR3021 TaxID=114890 RepID=A0AC35U385_9BILA